jgi:NAD-dependent deacetylase
VLYEEGLNGATVDAAIDALTMADLLIIGGTSLAVYPAAGFLRFFGGEHIVLINRDETPYDDRAELIFREKIGQVLKAAVELM